MRCKKDAVLAVVIAGICMLIYIWFRFKDVKFGASAVLALLHDVLCVLTVYALVRIPVGNTFIACMLTIVGYSINATIVIFDRIRENRQVMYRESLDEIVNASISQTLSRSINTSVTTFIAVFVLWILGVASIREFALPLMAGIIFGAYSSIFITGTLWYALKKLGKEKLKYLTESNSTENFRIFCRVLFMEELWKNGWLLPEKRILTGWRRNFQ